MARISQSEPFSDKFPVTGKNAGKFKLFPPEMVAIEFANNAISRAIFQSLCHAWMENLTGNLMGTTGI